MRIRSAGGELIVNVDKVGVAGFWNGVPRRADPGSGNTGNSSQGGANQHQPFQAKWAQFLEYNFICFTLIHPDIGLYM
jgi:hypothetical protein